MIRYIVEYQEYGGSITHSGKKISAFMRNEIVGKTGYIDWGNYSEDSKSSRLFIVEKPSFGIFVEEKFWKKGIGLSLLEKVIDLITEEDYRKLIILGAVKTAKDFYDKVFERLSQTNKISSFEVKPEGASSTFFNYDVFL